MRLGVFGLTPPEKVDANRALEWAIKEAARLDVEIVGGRASPDLPLGLIQLRSRLLA